MKYLLIALVLLLTFISCKKQPENTRKEPETLSGKWNYAQRFYSIGGPLIYESTKNLKQWILFVTSGGSFSSNMPDFKNVTSYEIVDSGKVKFNLPSQQPGSRLFFYKIDTSTNALSLSPADFICIEGCGYMFEPQ